MTLPHRVHERFIPACAGNTRRRGEHATRGRGQRFIPACAGNTTRTTALRRWKAVHPRVRGEHSVSGITAGTVQFRFIPACAGNTSPECRPPGLRRFIPACAGNTWAAPTRGRDPSVHPRVRGEHESDAAWIETTYGSSPRARGTLMAKRSWQSDAPTSSTVHPRVRGEHKLASRGCRGCGRFIPACAGNTVGSARVSQTRAVHPRVRGEHAGTSGPTLRRPGSSPRARGTRFAVGAKRGRQNRFIPACAGNTSDQSYVPGRTTWRFIPACAGNTLSVNR